MSEQDDMIKRLLRQYEYYQPQETLARVASKNKRLTIGLPKETAFGERRLALRPESVHLLINHGHQITIESGAGNDVRYSDREYSDFGASIAYNAQEVYESSDIILKVAPPTLKEIEMMQPRTTLISTLHLANVKIEYLQAINRKRITCIAFEMIQDNEDELPVVRSMSEIAGSAVLLIAAEYLNSENGQGIIVGGITGVPPTNVVIFGSGTVGEYAARAALGLGANLKVFDSSIPRLRRLKYNLGNQHLFTCTIDPDTIEEALIDADVAIGAMRPENGRTPCIVSEEMISKMKPNSVIIDVSIDNGGCFETSIMTSHEKPTFRKYDVIHYCVPNIAARVARTATNALSNIFTPLLLRTGEFGGMEDMIFNDNGFAAGVYAYQGEITNENLSRKFNMRYKDLGLLIAARGGFKD
ncbi:MAG: alanine dehydrogenase [Bernardetiaceae bacterium]|nr:alanine dehydrogenase [Bernardetiaceae bacterium]